MSMNRTDAFDDFIDAAYERSELWRLLQGVITGTAVFVVLASILVGGANLAFGFFETESLIDVLGTGSEPQSMFLILLSFGALFYAACAAAAWHHRDPGTLFGPRAPVLVDFFRMAVLAAVMLSGVTAASLYFQPLMITPQYAVADWGMMMLWAVPLLFVQVTAEEVVFRGYLLQQLAARFASPIIWAVLPSMLFGLLHFDPTIDTSLAVMGVIAATIFGLLATDLTRITGNLGAAIGYHFVNNFFALLLIGLPGRLSGLSLYLSGIGLDDVETLRVFMVMDIAIMLVVWVVARRLLQR